MFDTMNSPNRNLAIDRAVRDQGEGVRKFVCEALI